MPDAPKRRVLLLIPNLDFGGAQRSFSKISIGLTEHCDVDVAVFNTEAGVAFPYGGNLIDLKVAGGGNVVDKAKNFWARISRLKELKRKNRYDACISFLEGADYVNVLSKSGLGERTVISIRGSKKFDAEITGWRGKLRMDVMIPLSYRRADRIVAVSEGLRDEVLETTPEAAPRVRVIPNFYDNAGIQKLAAESLPAGYDAVFRHPVIINSSRLHIQKDFAGLLNVFALVVKQVPAARLCIIGDGSLREPLLKQAREDLGLRTHDIWSGVPVDDSYQVYFLGYQDNPFKFLAKANVFAFTSLYEGFPNSLAEAMICGVASISADCSTGPREIMAPNSGPPQQVKTTAEVAPFGILLPLLHQPNQPSLPNPGPLEAEWARVLVELLQDAPRRREMGKLAARRMEDFSKDKVFGQWVDLIDGK